MIRVASLIAWFALLLLPLPLRAQDADPSGWLPAASAPLTTGSRFRTGHGWLIVSVPTRTPPRTAMGSMAATNVRKEEIALLHLPPVAQTDFGGAPALKRAADLREKPEALAAFDDQVWAIFDPESIGTRASADGVPNVRRRVVRWRAALNIAGAWEYFPLGGAETVAALPGSGRLLGFTATARGPMALLLQSTLRLWLLDGASWREVALPAQVLERNAAQPLGTDAFAFATITADAERLWLLTREPDAAAGQLWHGAMIPPAGPQQERGGWAIDWEVPIEVPSPAPHSGDQSNVRLVSPDGRVLLLSKEGENVTMTPLTAATAHGGGSVWSATIPGPVAAVARDGLGRVVLVARSAPPSEEKGASAFAITEVTSSGAVVYAGPPKVTAVVTSVEFKLLAMLAGGLMVVVLVYVVRSAKPGVMALPPGFEPATPGRRLLASLVDMLVPALVGFALFGLRFSDFLGTDLIVRFDLAWRPLLATLGLAALLGAVNEGLTGRTLGKRITGCGVLTVRRVERPTPPDADPPQAVGEGDDPVFAAALPTMRAAFIRNLVKWFFPPLFLLAFLDPMLRSPADAIGRTVVVQRRPDEDDAEE